MADVFISYRNTPARRSLVTRLALIIQAHNISVWWDTGLAAGEDFEPQIVRELERASIVAPLWCAESIYSPWVLKEAQLGEGKLVPVRIQNVRPPAEFASLHAADLRAWNGSASDPKLAALLQIIRHRLKIGSVLPSSMLEDLCQLPTVEPLPNDDPETVAVLETLRNAYMRYQAVNIEDALTLTMDSPISELLGKVETAEDFERMLGGLCGEVDFFPLVDRRDWQTVPSVGHLVRLMVDREESEWLPLEPK